MQNYDVTVYMRGAGPKTILTQASNPVLAFDLAIRQLQKLLSDDEKLKVVGITLKPSKQEKKDECSTVG